MIGDGDISVKKIQYSIYKQETGSAGGKAKNDCYDILSSCGYIPSYIASDTRILRIIKQFFSIISFDKENILLVQYPTISDHLMSLLLKKLKTIDNSIAIVHDIPAFQGMGGDVEKQIDELNHFQYLIVHNDCMKKKMIECGCKSKMISLKVFDYLHDVNRTVQVNGYNGTIVVAGNLDKSTYLKDINLIDRYNFNLYGIKKIIDVDSINNATYMGLLPSDEIPYLLRGNYGLVWDGDSIDTCSGIHGEYLKINNPHKMSLYLAAGIPVIAWKKAAIADFIIENKIGVVVESLKELNYIDLSQRYDEMKNNVLNIKRKLAVGEYLKDAISTVESKIGI